MTAEVVTLGEALFALVARSGGPLFETRDFAGHVVGAEINTAIAIQRLGRDTAFIGRLGADGLGTAIRRRLRAEGVSAAHLRTDADAPTGVLVRTASPARPIEVVYARTASAGARLAPSDIDAARPSIEAARWLHVTGITAAISTSARDALLRALAIAQAARCTISLDLNYRRKLWPPEEAAAGLAPLIAAADVVFCGFDEATTLFGSASPAHAADALHSRGADVAILRCGASCVLHHALGDAPIEHAVSPVHVIDPIGAGDAFNGGYIVARLDGATYREAVALGEACKAHALAAFGDTTGLPTRIEAEVTLTGDAGDDR